MLRLSLKFIFIFLIFSAFKIYAESGTWTGNGGSFNWRSDDNWTGVTYPGDNPPASDGDIATFTDLAQNETILIGVGQFVTISQLNVEAPLTIGVNGDGELLNFTSIVDGPKIVYTGGDGTRLDIDVDQLFFPDASTSMSSNGEIRFSTQFELSAGNNPLTLNGNDNAIYSFDGIFTGNENAVNVSSGVTLNLLNTVFAFSAGEININEGTLQGNGTVSIENTALLPAEVTVVGGQTIAGPNSAGRLTIEGNYSQDTNSRLKVYVTEDDASQLIITEVDGNHGTCDLAGTLELVVEPGVYPIGNTKTILSAGGGITGTFSEIQENGADAWAFTVGDTTVTVTTIIPEVITAVPLNSLVGASRIVGNYTFLDPSFTTFNPDLTFVGNIVAQLEGSLFADSLIKLSPLAQASLVQSSYQNNLQMAVVLDKQFKENVRKKHSKKKSSKNFLENEELCYAIPKTGLFLEPIGIFYNQRQTGGPITNQGQIGFDSYTYGAGLGWEQVIDDRFIVEGGVGYTHSNLNWDDNFGNSKWSTLYIAPFFGWFNEVAFGNFMVMGAFNFVDTDRRISFPGLERVAESKYTSYDVLLRANGGARLKLGNNYWFQPEGTVNYLTTFTPSYTESGAGAISLNVKRNTNYIMQPSFRAKLIKQMTTKKFCYAPQIYVGWLANILLENQTLSARYKDAPNNIFFTINGYSETTNQLILGAELFAERFNQFILSSNFEVDMLSKFEVYTVKIKFVWTF